MIYSWIIAWIDKIDFDNRGDGRRAEKGIKDTRGVIRIRKSKKDRQHNGRKKRTQGQTTIYKTLHIKQKNRICLSFTSTRISSSCLILLENNCDQWSLKLCNDWGDYTRSIIFQKLPDVIAVNIHYRFSAKCTIVFVHIRIQNNSWMS